MRTPAIHVTAAARQAFTDATADAGNGWLRLAIDDRFICTLSFGAEEKDDLTVDAGGLTIRLDPSSAARADNLSIDFVTRPEGAGFTIDNPNVPPAIRQISAVELKSMMDTHVPFELVDVRTPQERALARIEGSRLFDKEGHDYVMGLDRNTMLVFQCHHGIRSQAAAEYCLEQGFKNICNLRGGIDAWSTLVDPEVPRY
jgi:monothiol glutaredoxin